MSGPIPEKYINFSKAVASLAREIDLNSFGLSMQPLFSPNWKDPIQMKRERDRLGGDSDKLTITSTITVIGTIDV